MKKKNQLEVLEPIWKKMTEIKIHNSPIRSDEGLTKG